MSHKTTTKNLGSEYGKLSKIEVQYGNRVKKITELLSKFNVEADIYGTFYGIFVDGEVRIPHHKTYSIEFNEDTWKFVYPLLKEVLRYRKMNSIPKD